jgi:hypothetical protein
MADTVTRLLVKLESEAGTGYRLEQLFEDSDPFDDQR